jgi:4-hydroxythreonine-4-phosphate dehydrogenase
VAASHPNLPSQGGNEFQTKRLVLTPGEPAGIGPDITIMMAQQDWPAEIIVIADPVLLQERATQLSLPLKIEQADLDLPVQASKAQTLKVLPIQAGSVTPGQLSIKNAAYVLETLALATKLCLEKKADAIVTGPVQKEIINQAGIAFSGHTEFFAEVSSVAQTIMLFVVNELKVALLTTHLPLANVPNAITSDKLKRTCLLLNNELKKWFGLNNPRIAICGLNPHAGEGGYLGREEIDTIIPAMQQLSAEGLCVIGPFPADTIFTPSQLIKADVVLAMYHDQALPVVKYAGFGNAVNVTLGLPFIRTSVDHGTALDKAGSGLADASSLIAAMQLALKLSGSS